MHLEWINLNTRTLRFAGFSGCNSVGEDEGSLVGRGGIGERVCIHRGVMRYKEEARSRLEMTLGNRKASYDLGFESARGFY